VRGTRDDALSVQGSIEANNGETLGQLAAAGVGIARVGAFSVADQMSLPVASSRSSRNYNPGDIEAIHAVFVGRREHARPGCGCSSISLSSGSAGRPETSGPGSARTSA
jgi:DNA-binding transcriptional LysR family regulator